MPLCNIPRARYQTMVAHWQGPHRFEGNGTELPLGSTMKQSKKACHFALRESTIMFSVDERKKYLHEAYFISTSKRGLLGERFVLEETNKVPGWDA